MRKYSLLLVVFTLVLNNFGSLNVTMMRDASHSYTFEISQSSPQLIASAYAADRKKSDDTCISDIKKNRQSNSTGDGLVTQIIDYIKDVIDDTSSVLFQGIVQDPGFQAAVKAAFALMIAVFGAAFMFGVVPLTYSQALTRGLKMAFVMALISSSGWSYFSDNVVTFFNDGTDEIIDAVIGIATGDTSSSVGNNGQPQPFKKIESLATDALSPEMMISTLTAFTTGPMGPAIGGMLGIGLVAFIQMLVRAVRVYVISLVAKALLFGLAPIFISFILFERTKNMFTGWLNQLVNYSLQPILLFAFLSFFIVLLQSTVENILGVDVCWTPINHVEGATGQEMFWRYVDKDGNPTTSDFTWEGLASCIKSGASDCQEFPISILDVLTFLILSHLAYRFSDVVVHIATEISSSTLALDKLRSGLGEMIQKSQNRTSGGKQST